MPSWSSTHVRIGVAARGSHALLRGQEIANVRGVGVVVLVAVERFPRGDVARILRTSAYRRVCRLERIARQRIEVVVLLARGDECRRVRVVVDGADRANGGQE